MNQSFFRQVKIASLIVLILFLMAGIYFLCFFDSKNESSKNTLSVSFKTSDIIHMDNTLPISDVLGKKIDSDSLNDQVQGYVEFSITNPSSYSVKYDIFLTKQAVEGDEIKENYIKFYLTDDQDVPFNGFEKNAIPSFNTLYYLTDKPSSKLLYSGTLSRNETKKYRLRVWLSDQYAISFQKEYFSVDVDVRSK